jgi:hypothetical protein
MQIRDEQLTTTYHNSARVIFCIHLLFDIRCPFFTSLLTQHSKGDIENNNQIANTHTPHALHQRNCSTTEEISQQVQEKQENNNTNHINDTYIACLI